MAVKPGDKIPDIEIRTMGADGKAEPIKTGDVLAKGKVVLFAVPGAFTPGCSKTHLPGYVQGADELKAKGVDTIACIAINDAYVMDAWGKAQGVGDKIVMLADGDGAFTKALGLEADMPAMGLRSKRYSMLIEDGVVKDLELEPKPGIEQTTCETMLTLI
jgi:peroxiredoxin